MQSDTGCKINVSQASGADIEREIGLVGTRQAIDDAKRAIWEKVDQVVSTLPTPSSRAPLTPCRRRRTTLVVVITAMATATGAMMDTHKDSKLQLPTTVQLQPHSLLPP
jgi:hypothetical protein